MLELNNVSSVADLIALSESPEPIILRGLLDGWSTVGVEGTARLLDEWSALLVQSATGAARMGALGPEVLNAKSSGLVELSSVRRDIHRAQMRPSNEELEYDLTLFHNVSGSDQLRAVLADAPVLLRELATRSEWSTTRLSLGGPRSGIGFHNHAVSVNFLLGGRKRWFLHHGTDLPRSLRMNWYGRVNRGMTMLEWLERAYPTPEVQAAWRAHAWECTQRAGDALVVPAQAWHAIINLEPETAALVVKRDGVPKVDNPHARPPSTTLLSMAYEPPDETRAGLWLPKTTAL